MLCKHYACESERESVCLCILLFYRPGWYGLYPGYAAGCSGWSPPAASSVFCLEGRLKPDWKSKPALFWGPGDCGGRSMSVFCLRGGGRPTTPPASGRPAGPPENWRWGPGAESAENCRYGGPRGGPCGGPRGGMGPRPGPGAESAEYCRGGAGAGE